MRATFDKSRSEGLKEFWYEWEYNLTGTKGISRIYCDNDTTFSEFVKSANENNPHCSYLKSQKPDDSFLT